VANVLVTFSREFPIYQRQLRLIRLDNWSPRSIATQNTKPKKTQESGRVYGYEAVRPSASPDRATCVTIGEFPLAVDGHRSIVAAMGGGSTAPEWTAPNEHESNKRKQRAGKNLKFN
jgi:hypothetical protein